MKSFIPVDRLGFDGVPEGPAFIAEATMQELLLPGKRPHPDTGDGGSKFVLRDSGENESLVEDQLFDPYSLNCLYPNEVVQVIMDPQSGLFIPNGSNGLLRRAKVTATIAAGESESVSLISLDENDVELVVGSVVAYSDDGAAENDKIWITFQRDLDKSADNDDQKKVGAAGRWKVITTGSGLNNGVVRGKAQSDFDSDDPAVDVEVTFSLLPDVIVGQIVTATNWIGYEGDRYGECYVYYHGDGTGNEDGSFDLMGARCPA